MLFYKRTFKSLLIVVLSLFLVSTLVSTTAADSGVVNDSVQKSSEIPEETPQVAVEPEVNPETSVEDIPSLGSDISSPDSTDADSVGAGANVGESVSDIDLVKPAKSGKQDGNNASGKVNQTVVFDSPAMNGLQSRTGLPVNSVGRIQPAPLPLDLRELKFKDKLIRSYGGKLVHVATRVDLDIAPVESNLNANYAVLVSLQSDLEALTLYLVNDLTVATLSDEDKLRIVTRITEINLLIESFNAVVASDSGRLNLLKNEKQRILDILGFYKAVDNTIKGTPFPKSQVKSLLLSTAAPFDSFPEKVLVERDWNSLHGLTYKDLASELLISNPNIFWSAPIFNNVSSEISTSSLVGSQVMGLKSMEEQAFENSEIFNEMADFNPLLAVKVNKTTALKIMKTSYANKILALPVLSLKSRGRNVTVAGIDDKAASILKLSVKPTEFLTVFSTGSQAAMGLRTGDLVKGKPILESVTAHGGFAPSLAQPEANAKEYNLIAGGFQDLPLGVGAVVDAKLLTNFNQYIVLFNNDTDFRNVLKQLNKVNPSRILQKTPAPSRLNFYTQKQAQSLLGSGSYTKVNRSDPDAIRLPSSFTSKHIKVNKFPVLGTFPCSRFMAKQLAGALAHAAVSGLSTSLVPSNFGGCYASRFMRTRPTPSYHAWGLAIDLDPSNNQLHSVGTLDRRLVPIFKSWGFRWGGDWRTLDPMHFEVAKLLK